MTDSTANAVAPANPGRRPDLSFGMLHQPREVIFGAGQRAVTGTVVAELGSTAALITDARMGADSWFRGLVSELRAGGVTAVVFDGTEPDLPVPNVLAAVEAVRAMRPEVIVGIGGGSCLDMAKVVAVLLTHGGAPADYYGEFQVPGPTMPIVAVPTTAGTGSEVTTVAVLTDPDLGVKIGITSPHIVPHTAIVDPELTFSSPAGLTAAAGADALVHVIESYTAVRKDRVATLSRDRAFVGRNALTDHYALLGMTLIGRSLRPAVLTGGNGEYRVEMMMGALCGGFALGNAGTAAAHAFQYPVGALTHTPHGLGTGCLLPYVMAFNGSAVAEQMSDVALALGVEPAAVAADPVRTAVATVSSLFADIGIPRTLADLGVDEGQLDYVAENGLKAKRLVDNNPVPLGLDEARVIVNNAFHGRLD